jgi:hypothetical protein
LLTRAALLRSQNHTRVVSTGSEPLRVKSIEIRDVERIEDTLLFSSKGQLFLIGLLGQAGVQGCDHGDTARTESRNKIAIHSVFVEVDFDPTHR